MCPPLILNLSLIVFRTGTIAFVVHEAADIIWSFSSRIESFIPYTIFLIFPFAGAVKITFEAPDLI